MRRLFGNAFAEANEVLVQRARARRTKRGAGAASNPDPLDTATRFTRLVMSVVITLIAVGIGVLAMWSSNETLQKFGTGLIGTSIGYWLR